MPRDLKRYQHSTQSHFVTFSCHRRLPLLGEAWIRDLFLECLERTRWTYRLRVFGYVVMPEHVHLLVSEPEAETLATALQSLKISVAHRARHYQPQSDPTLWQKRYYDHNVRSYESFVGKLRYLHRNPVKRGLVTRPEDWKWSSFRHYATAEIGIVELESQWTAERRNVRMPQVLDAAEK